MDNNLIEVVQANTATGELPPENTTVNGDFAGTDAFDVLLPRINIHGDTPTPSSTHSSPLDFLFSSIWSSSSSSCSSLSVSPPQRPVRNRKRCNYIVSSSESDVPDAPPPKQIENKSNICHNKIHSARSKEHSENLLLQMNLSAARRQLADKQKEIDDMKRKLYTSQEEILALKKASEHREIKFNSVFGTERRAKNETLKLLEKSQQELHETKTNVASLKTELQEHKTAVAQLTTKLEETTKELKCANMKISIFETRPIQTPAIVQHIYGLGHQQPRKRNEAQIQNAPKYPVGFSPTGPMFFVNCTTHKLDRDFQKLNNEVVLNAVKAVFGATACVTRYRFMVRVFFRTLHDAREAYNLTSVKDIWIGSTGVHLHIEEPTADHYNRN